MALVRETHRRLAALAVLGVAAVACAVAVSGKTVVNVASAAAAPHVASAPARRFATCPFPRSLRTMFEAASRDAQLPPAMLYAVAKVESNLNEDATSAAGARGLLQVMPSTARALDLDGDEPSGNVLAGARYLRELMDRFDNADLALAAYNAGPTAVTISGGAPTLGVIRYVANVNAVWRAHAGCL